ncbi:pseudouridine synthase [Tuber brumale]|nr:pseudouridine synthase [Tuber brumale]
MAPQGLFAVQKPQGLTSAAIIRHLQAIFRNHAWFKPDLTARQNAVDSQSRGQRQRRRRPRQVEVKMGHAGTLDPLATGVLVIGVGTGTKSLSSLISCTKTYETTALFGASTDTYDCTGRILKRAPHSHITPQLIDSALDAFRGEILQKPPIYSALHHEGKRYYEYAREGKPLPIDIKARPMTVSKMELMGFGKGGEHGFGFPGGEGSAEEKVVGEVMRMMGAEESKKRVLEVEEEGQEEAGEAKKVKVDDTLFKQAEETIQEPLTTDSPSQPPPIASLRMSVSSGFYVRSLIHDLGEALGSAAHMVQLTRTQQAQFELGKNVIPWEDMMSEDTTKWESQLEAALRETSDEGAFAKRGEDVEEDNGVGGAELKVEGMEGKGS